ncbi:MAG: hypothetical protein DDT34_02529 [Firmicutes bacterium]|nr:hypothetical protein [Bacillota bacterium]
MRRVVARLKHSDGENRLLISAAVLKFPQFAFTNRPEALRWRLKPYVLRRLHKERSVLALFGEFECCDDIFEWTDATSVEQRPLYGGVDFGDVSEFSVACRS